MDKKEENEMQTLRYGSQGLWVEYVQLALTRAGQETGDIDGIFGRRTLRAAERFQAKSGIASDGIIGARTWGALFPYLSGYTVLVTGGADTPASICDRFGVDCGALLVANPWLKEGIREQQTILVPLPFSVVTDAVAPSSFLVAVWMNGLLARYPFLRQETVGYSRLGKSIDALAVGTGSIPVCINAAHHANEWITTSLVMMLMEQYLAAVTEDGTMDGISARELFKRTALYLVPLVNPDGVDLVTGLLPSSDPTYLQAKALASRYPDIPFPNGWKANSIGVDLNLGYPADWARAREIKFAQGYTHPGPRDYVGIAPLCEPENRAMAGLAERRRFHLSVSYHTQGAEIYWRYRDIEPKNGREIGRAFSDASGYRLADAPPNSSYAGYKDWLIQSFGYPAFTVEAGRGNNPLPITELPMLLRENVGIFAKALALAPEYS